MKYLVAGVDPSLTGTGIAIIRDGIPTLHTIGSRGFRDDPWPTRAQRLTTLRNRVMGIIPRDTTLAVLEGPSFGSTGAGTHDRSWYWGKLYDAFVALGIPLAVVPPKTRAKWSCDDGNGDKAKVLDGVSKLWRGVDIRGDDQADALCFASIAAQHLGLPVPYPVQERHKLALSKIEWPQLPTTADTLTQVPGETGSVRTANQEAHQ